MCVLSFLICTCQTWLVIRCQHSTTCYLITWLVSSWNLEIFLDLLETSWFLVNKILLENLLEFKQVCWKRLNKKTNLGIFVCFFVWRFINKLVITNVIHCFISYKFSRWQVMRIKITERYTFHSFWHIFSIQKQSKLVGNFLHTWILSLTINTQILS